MTLFKQRKWEYNWKKTKVNKFDNRFMKAIFPNDVSHLLHNKHILPLKVLNIDFWNWNITKIRVEGKSWKTDYFGKIIKILENLLYDDNYSMILANYVYNK